MNIAVKRKKEEKYDDFKKNHDGQNQRLNKKKGVGFDERSHLKERIACKRKSSEKNDEAMTKQKLSKVITNMTKHSILINSSHTKITSNTKKKVLSISATEKKVSRMSCQDAGMNKPNEKQSSEGEKKPKKEFIGQSEKLIPKTTLLNKAVQKRKLIINDQKGMKSSSHPTDSFQRFHSVGAFNAKGVTDFTTVKEANMKDEKIQIKHPRKNKRDSKSSGVKSLSKSRGQKLKQKATVKHIPPVPEVNINDPLAMLMMMEGKKSAKVSHSSMTPHSSSSGLKSSLFVGHNEEMDTSDDSDELSDWEDVKDHSLPVQKDDYSHIPKEPVQITLDMPSILQRKRKKKQFDWKAHLQKQVRKFKKGVAINIHKSHILCLIALGLKQNSILNDETLKGLILSVVPTHFIKATTSSTERLVDGVMSWYRKKYPLDRITHTSGSTLISINIIVKTLSETSISDARLWVLIFIIVLRTLGLSVRLVLSLYPISFKDSESGLPSSKAESKKKDKTKSSSCQPKPVSKVKSSKLPQSSSSSSSTKTPSSSSKSHSTQQSKHSSSSSSQKPTAARRLSRDASMKAKKNLHEDSDEMSDESNSPDKASGRSKKSKEKKRRESVKTKPCEEDEEMGNFNSDSDFEETSRYFSPTKELKIKSNRKILSHSEDDEDESTNAKAHNFWLEVFMEDKKKWTCFDCFKNVFGRPYALENRATQPVKYVVAFRNDNGVTDVTRRYTKQWFSQTRKIRVDANWLEETFAFFDKATYEEKVMEEDEIKSQLMVRPMPSSIGDFKGHPLYALRRHLLKFEAVYPDTAIPLGYIRNEPVYARECVRTLHSRDNWLKEGRLVRLKEEPYKMVKSRPKWNKPKENPDELDLELFGEWQTEIYIPPPAVNGKVPKNEYGNVELFKPWMLPSGTVQLKLQGLNRVARKLNIDVAPAMVGWDHHSGHAHPIFDGFIVCKEFADALLDAWDEDQEIQQQKEDEKREKRIYGNWKLLIRGLLIKERLRAKFLQTSPLMDYEEAKAEQATFKSPDAKVKDSRTDAASTSQVQKEDFKKKIIETEVATTSKTQKGELKKKTIKEIVVKPKKQSVVEQYNVVTLTGKAEVKKGKATIKSVSVKSDESTNDETDESTNDETDDDFEEVSDVDDFETDKSFYIPPKNIAKGICKSTTGKKTEAKTEEKTRRSTRARKITRVESFNDDDDETDNDFEEVSDMVETDPSFCIAPKNDRKGIEDKNVKGRETDVKNEEKTKRSTRARKKTSNESVNKDDVKEKFPDTDKVVGSRRKNKARKINSK